MQTFGTISSLRMVLVMDEEVPITWRNVIIFYNSPIASVVMCIIRMYGFNAFSFSLKTIYSEVASGTVSFL